MPNLDDCTIQRLKAVRVEIRRIRCLGAITLYKRCNWRSLEAWIRTQRMKSADPPGNSDKTWHIISVSKELNQKTCLFTTILVASPLTQILSLAHDFERADSSISSDDGVM